MCDPSSSKGISNENMQHVYERPVRKILNSQCGRVYQRWNSLVSPQIPSEKDRHQRTAYEFFVTFCEFRLDMSLCSSSMAISFVSSAHEGATEIAGHRSPCHPVYSAIPNCWQLPLPFPILEVLLFGMTMNFVCISYSSVYFLDRQWDRVIRSSTVRYIVIGAPIGFVPQTILWVLSSRFDN
jgi:hypothetical protein